MGFLRAVIGTIALWGVSIAGLALALGILGCPVDPDNPLDPSNVVSEDPFKLTIMPQSAGWLLEWQSIGNPGVTGYRLYRGVLETNLTPLVTLPGTDHGYLDQTAEPGNTYYYAVTALGGANKESVRSSVVTNLGIGEPRLSVQPDSLHFEAFRGGLLPSPETLLVKNLGGGTLTWQVSVVNGSWLNVHPDSGVGNSMSVAVDMNTTEIGSDALSAELVFVGADTAIVVPVTSGVRDLYGYEQLYQDPYLKVEVFCADLDGDGDDEIIVGSPTDGTYWNWNILGAECTGMSGIAPTAVGDINNDGKIDIAAAVVLTHTFRLHLNNGGGGFIQRAGPDWSRSSQGYASAVVMSDLNNDGKTDLVAGCEYRMVFWKSRWGLDGQWTLDTVASLAVPDIGDRVVKCRLNGDAYDDFACISASSIAVILSSGPAQFAAPTYYSPCGEPPTDLCVKVNSATGQADLAVSCSSGTLAILVSNGQGQLSQSCRSVAGYPGATIIESSDFDENGFEDLATLTEQSVAIFLFSEAGMPPTPVYFPVPSRPVKMARLDYDGDGDVDLAVIGSYSLSTGRVALLRNNLR